jgi:hypothetical protein
MKRIAVYLTICHLAFTCGVAAASFWNRIKVKPRNEQIHLNVLEQAPASPRPYPPPPVNSIPAIEPHYEAVFGDDGLRIVAHQRRLKSAQLRYEIDVSYPEIVGTNDPELRKLNQRMKRLATEQYQWLMNPLRGDLQHYKETFPDVFNSMSFDYEISLATDPLLSIYFVGYSYGIGAAHSVQYSFTVNYDLTLRKELQLSDIFKPGSRYLEIIDRYCREELSKRLGGNIFLSPGMRNFKSWNITPVGIRFNFDACTIRACADGNQTVEIPFSYLEPWLNSRMLSCHTTKGQATCACPYLKNQSAVKLNGEP